LLLVLPLHVTQHLLLVEFVEPFLIFDKFVLLTELVKLIFLLGLEVVQLVLRGFLLRLNLRAYVFGSVGVALDCQLMRRLLAG
jgi:hypothetical protein